MEAGENKIHFATWSHSIYLYSFSNKFTEFWLIKRNFRTITWRISCYDFKTILKSCGVCVVCVCLTAADREWLYSLHDFLKYVNCIYIYNSWCFSPRGSFRYNSGVAAGPRAPLRENSLILVKISLRERLPCWMCRLFSSSKKLTRHWHSAERWNKDHYVFRNMFLY